MPDTGAAAGQQVEVALQLKQNGTALSYADKSAFTAAGWDIIWRVAQADQTVAYTVQPHTDTDAANEGWHLVVFTLINGQGPIIVTKPTSGSGWRYAWGPQQSAESTDLDALKSQILQSGGVTVQRNGTAQKDVTVTAGTSNYWDITIPATTVTDLGFSLSDLNDGTLTLYNAIRESDNAEGIPNAFLGVGVNDVSSDLVLDVMITEYALSALTGVHEGMDIIASDEATTTTFLYDIEARGKKTIAIAAISAGDDTLSFAGDQRKWFAPGTVLTVSGSTDVPNGEYTVSDSVWPTYNGTNTTVTFTEDITGSTVDGNIEIDVIIALAKGTITAVGRQAS